MPASSLVPTPHDYSAGAAFIAATDPDWSLLVKRVGPCGWRVNHAREPYEALVRAIAYQQIHGRAADAILGRFLDLYPGASFPAPDSVLATESILMRGVGFSASKIAAIRAIAAGAVEGVIPTRADASALDDETLIARLVSIRGVGRWTVEMMLMSTLGRPDVLPVDDFGVREGWRILKGFAKHPTPKQLAEAGQAWKPYRSIASWYLWRAADEAKEKARSATAAVK